VEKLSVFVEGTFHLGVVVWQLVIEKNGKLDVKRTAVITFLGLVLVGPTLHIW
jgi:peroxisomal membrane protein 2